MPKSVFGIDLLSGLEPIVCSCGGKIGIAPSHVAGAINREYVAVSGAVGNREF